MTYEAFIAAVDELGFIAFSKGFLEGFPHTGSVAAGNEWFTGDPDTDPWQWRDRAAQEGRLAFGCVLGGHKGFIAKRCYPLFLAAYRRGEDMEYRYARGEVSQATMRLYGMFEGGAVVASSEAREALRVTKKKGAGVADGALKALQAEFLITVCGNKRKLNKQGLEYGWPSNAYRLVDYWAPPGWLDGWEDIDERDARQRILDRGVEIGVGVDRAALAKLLRF